MVFDVVNGFIRSWVPALLLAVVSSGVGRSAEVTEQEAYQAYQDKDYKEARQYYSELLKSASLESAASLKMRLALACYRDQDDVAAFRSYLEALEVVRPRPTLPASAEEQRLMEEGLRMYLNPSGVTSREMALVLGEKYAPMVKEHPEYFLLNFLVASAHANLGLFDDFFERFFVSYERYPDYFLAYKIRGLLHVKLFERLSDSSEREEQRSLALTYLQKAVAIKPEDHSLYRMIIALSRSEDKHLVVVTSLKAMTDADIMVPRRDIYFYVQQAVEVGEEDLARLFLDKTKCWYQYSRIIDAAEQLIEHQG